jgi:diguanylate cyclase (GGDEF)-like protein/PAS domain S-box-containing protein
MSSPGSTAASTSDALPYLQSALDAADFCVVVYDAQRCFVACNHRYRELFPEIAPLLTPGRSLEDILAAFFRADGPAIPGTISERDYLASRLALFRAGEDTRGVMRCGNRLLRVCEHRMPDGGMISLAYEIMEPTRTEHQLRILQRITADLAELCYDWYWRQDADLRYVEFSGGLDRYVDLARETWYGKQPWELAIEGVSEEQWAAHRAQLAARQPFHDFEYRIRTACGVRWFLVNGKALYDDDDDRFYGYHGVGRDITERKQAEQTLRESEERFRALTELSSDWYWVQDENFRFVSASRGVELSDLTFSVGRTRWELPVSEVTDEQWSEHRALLEAHQPFRNFSYRIADKNGRDRWLSISGEPIFDRDGNFSGYHGVGKDITDRIEAEREIARLAQFDFLTELPNRTLFDDRLQQAISTALRSGRRFTLLFIDLDRFRGVNHRHGQAGGDALLREIARRLAACLRAADTVCRRGGDEFLVLLPLVDDATVAARLCERLLHEAALPVELRKASVSLTASIGVSAYPEDGADAATLLQNADAAMCQAKSSGRKAYRFFNAAVHERVGQRLALERRLADAFAGRMVEAYYQPQIDLRSGAVSGVEALLHWRDAELGEIKPEDFASLAETTHLVLPLGEWLLVEACRQAREWQRQNVPPIRVAVKVAVAQFQHADMVQLVKQSLADAKLAPSLLELDITTSALSSDEPAIIEQLAALSRTGVKIALDDFRISCTGAQHLLRFKIDRLKIDPECVRVIDSASAGAAISAAMIHLGHALDLRVLAQGVDTAAQRDVLARHGCDDAQGGFLAAPLAGTAFAQWLARHPA